MVEDDFSCLASAALLQANLLRDPGNCAAPLHSCLVEPFLNLVRVHGMATASHVDLASELPPRCVGLALGNEQGLVALLVLNFYAGHGLSR